MDRPDKKNLPGVVIGNNKQKRHIPSKKKSILLVGGGLLLVLIAVSVILFLRSKSEEPGYYTDFTSTEKTLRSINELAKTDLDAAKKQYQDFINEQNGNKAKAEYSRSLGNLCFEHQDYKCLLESFEQADKFGEEDYYSAYAKAYAKEQLGDEGAAKTGYERAKQLLQSTDVTDPLVEIEQIEEDIIRVSG